MNRNRNAKPQRKGVRNFIGRLLLQTSNSLLPQMDHPDQRVSVAGKRATWARDLLESDHFQEVIQFMNEEVVSDIVETEALDTDRLTMLRLRLQIISDFQHRLVWFVEEYGTLLVEEEQRQRSEEQASSNDQLGA